jgi:hypothetical protein
MNSLESRVRAATAATAEDIAPGSIPPLDLPGRADPGRPRPGRDGPRRGGGLRPRVLIPLAAAASVVAVVAMSLAIAAGPHRQATAGSSPTPPASATTPAGAPPGAFRYVGTGPLINGIECVTASVCYAWDMGVQGQPPERTSDGGVTWRPVALSRGQGRAPLQGVLLQQVTPSCPTPEVCVAWAGGLKLAVTTDGGGSWKIESLPRPAGVSGASVDQVSCATAEWCVVHVADAGQGTFLVTTDGGRTWDGSARLPAGAPRDLWLLRCDPGGRCIGTFYTGTNKRGGLAILRSTDGGHSWTLGSTPSPPSGPFMMSCGDASYCMFIGDNGVTMTTSDGGIAWRDNADPRPYPYVVTSVSCPAAGVCYLALAAVTGGGYSRPVIEATHDGGLTWTPLKLPAAGGSPLAVVDLVSCATPAGCIGIAATVQEQSGNRLNQRTVISTLPASSPARS